MLCGAGQSIQYIWILDERENDEKVGVCGCDHVRLVVCERSDKMKMIALVVAVLLASCSIDLGEEDSGVTALGKVVFNRFSVLNGRWNGEGELVLLVESEFYVIGRTASQEIAFVPEAGKEYRLVVDERHYLCLALADSNTMTIINGAERFADSFIGTWKRVKE